MKRIPSRGIAVLALAAAFSATACECADRHDDDTVEPTDANELETMAEATTESTAEEPTAGTTEEPVNVSRFIGIFHNEHWIVPFGREVDNTGGVSLANLEIHADGTAAMTMETCDEEFFGTLEIGWRWEAHPGPWLELTRGPGEESLRFMAWTNLESLRMLPYEPCAFRFEVDGVPIMDETFRPGEACWVNRCEPSWRIHIDYCDGEPPPPCE